MAGACSGCGRQGAGISRANSSGAWSLILTSDDRKVSVEAGTDSVSLYRRLEQLLWGLGILAAVASGGIVVLIGAGVSMRYFAFTPLSFTEELVGLLMTTAFFLALPLTTLRAEHVRIVAVVSVLPERWRSAVEVIASVFGAVFCLWLLILCLPWLEFAINRQIKTEVGRLLLYPWMALFPLSLFLTLIAFLTRRSFSKKTQPHSASAMAQ